MSERFKKGEYVSVQNYYLIFRELENGRKFELQPKKGAKFLIDKEILEDEGKSAGWFITEKLVTMTELADYFCSKIGTDIFTVCFTKQDNTKRILIGHRIETIPNLGYSMVEDHEVTSGSPLREVNHRTILWLIHNGVKLSLKTKKSSKK